MMRIQEKAIIIALFFLFIIPVFSQEPKPDPLITRILFVFDGSYSMNGTWQNTKKITIARNTLISIIDSLEKIPNIEMALRVYGHQSPVPPQDCNDTKLEVYFGKNNASAIRQKLRFLTPLGTTPLAKSLEKAAGDFPKNCDNCRNIIILITDGLEECKGDPCEVSLRLQKEGITLKPFVIGIGIDENFRKSFDCIGHFYNATNEEQFTDVMRIVITQVLNSTTAQVNLLDQSGKPTETDVNLTFFDSFSGKIKHNYIHTINYNGFPDTLILDPLVTYRMRVNTLPPVEVDNIKLEPGKHTIIAARTPQGSLIVKTEDGNPFRDLKFTVRKTGTTEVLNFQDLNKPEKYLIGKYEIDIPTLPPLILKEIDIKQSHTTTVEIPRPGKLNLLYSSTGYGSLYLREGDKLTWIFNLSTDVKSETLTLLPGNYVVVFRPKNARQTINSTTKKFEIRSGAAVSVNL